ncbi:phosphate/phosphite/phosphonate ABC transporter substrate-binding protein [Synechococcus sp. BDU 130192]|uniref:phosphate/phosphite/phosphonate ABC transporter substrate-binding protein n=1 Tax=Synechococcus sp. BDU 130192 TaxID=2042059 RepID=UPI000C0851B8|nr:PhnD/SsuA/transferrin family substrate-binding protein [Synechococcus sp. BDU 130192]
MSITIQLQNLVNSTPEELENVKTALARGLADSTNTIKLNCLNVSNVSDELLHALLCYVPTNFRNAQGLDSFIFQNHAFTGPLRVQILEYFKNNPEPEKIPGPGSEPKPIKKIIVSTSAATLVLCVFLGLIIKSYPYFRKPKLENTQLIIGTIFETRNQFDLADYLEESFVPKNYWDFLRGEKVKVYIDGDGETSYEKAKENIEEKTWDIAFTASPVLSIYAKQKQYSFAAEMFPGQAAYESGLFVRTDSPIQSINDITAEHTIALGEFGTSASSFYMPVYDLYGRTLNLDLGNRGAKIKEKVETGVVDIGAAFAGYAEDPNLRLIAQSRAIPSSGVYLSPNLSSNDQKIIQKVMLSASENIRSQDKSNYGAGQEVDYSSFQKIVERIDELIVCSDFTKNPVNLFCPQGMQVIGRVNGWSKEESNYKLTFSTADEVQHLMVPEFILNELGINNIQEIQDKQITISVQPQQTQVINNVKVTTISQASQLKVDS